MVSQLTQADAVPEQGDKNDREGEQGKEHGNKHLRGHVETSLRGAGIRANDHRMNGAEEANGDKCNRYTDGTDEGVYRAEPGAPIGIVNPLAQ